MFKVTDILDLVAYTQHTENDQRPYYERDFRRATPFRYPRTRAKPLVLVVENL